MLRKLLSLLCFTALFVPSVMAQSGSLTGTVTDAKTGEPVIGANVYLQQIQRGAATDENGEYTISNIQSGTYTLRVTYVGYQTYSQQVQVQQGSNEEDVELKAGAIGLDELVVTGYGTDTKRSLTGSVSSIQTEEIKDVPLQNTEGLLQGRAAGVAVTSTSGNPGGGYSVRIRGRGSINAGTEPLYIVDGVQISFANQSGQTSNNPLNAINPNDIKSIEVLKDAAAAAIYGSQASNGVVLITTKTGRQGDTRISASVQRGVRSNANEIDFLGLEDWYNFSVESLQNNPGFGVPTFDAAAQLFRNAFFEGYGYDVDAPLSELKQRGTDWVNFATDPGISQRYNMSFSGGGEQTSFYVSGNYENTEGTVLDNTYRNYGLTANFNQQVSSRLNIHLKTNISSQKQLGVCQDGNFINCPVSAAYFEPPLTFPYLDDGSYSPFTAFGISNNIAVLKNEVNRPVNTLQLIGNIGGTYDLTEWLDISGQLGMDYRNTNDKRFESPVANPSDIGSVSQAERQVSNFITNLRANFVHTFGENNNVSGLLGTEYRRELRQFTSARGTGLPVGFSVINAAATPNSVGGFNTEYRLASYFGSLKYNYAQRYYLQFTGRYDGSSRFGVENRFGFFPSVSAAWNISEEDFFNSSFINLLKLRGSYGVTGNNQIGNFSSRQLYGLAGSYNGVRGLAPSQLGNSSLTWEKAKEVDLGLDIEFFDSRLSGSFDVYSKNTDDLLLGQPIPVDNGFGAITQNVGGIRNQGLEISLNSFNVRTDNFSWRTRFNITFQRNEITQLNEGQDQLNSGFSNTLKVGQPLGVFNYPEYAGVNPADGRPFWYDKDGNLTYTPTQADNKFGDSGIEDAYGGFGNTVAYKGLSLDFLFQFSYGATAFDQSAWYFARSANIGGNIYAYEKDRWQNPGDITSFPKAYWGNVYPGTANFRVQAGTHMTDDAGYIRLKNVTLSFSLPTSLTQKINIRNVRVFATGINLLTWTQWPGFDPEAIGEDFGQSFGNVTAASYPTARQINAGIEVDF